MKEYIHNITDHTHILDAPALSASPVASDAAPWTAEGKGRGRGRWGFKGSGRGMWGRGGGSRVVVGGCGATCHGVGS